MRSFIGLILVFGVVGFPQGAHALPSESNPSVLDSLFFAAMESIQARDLGEASERFDAVKQRAYDFGYENLSVHSVRLLELANGRDDFNETETAYLVRRAVMLSPGDARIVLAAASYYQTIGIPEALGYGWKALTLLPKTPTVVISMMLNVLFVGLVAVTVALFLVCVVQLVCNIERVISAMMIVVPDGFRGITGPLVTFIALVLPLFGGLLVAIAGWALLLSFSLRSCRSLALLTAVFVLCWARAIPILETLGARIQSELVRAVEEVNNGNYSPFFKERLLEAVERNPRDPVLNLTLARELTRQGALEDARVRLETSLSFSELADDPTLRSALKLQLGTVAFLSGQYEQAKTIFSEEERAGNDSLPVLFNLAQSHLALLDTAQHREFFNRAGDADRAELKRLQEVEAGGDAAMRKLASFSLPSWRKYLPYLGSIHAGDDAQALFSQYRRMQLTTSLMRGGSEQVLLAFGGILVLISIWLMVRRRRPMRLAASTPLLLARPRSRIWLFLPAGAFVAGEAPSIGVLLLGIFVACSMVALGRPTELFEIAPAGNSLQTFWFAVVIFNFTLLLISSLIFSDRFGHATKAEF